MGFRFRRLVKILPGIRVNFGKTGISTSVGVRGAHVTFGKSGTRTAVGVPGTGLSYTELERPQRRQQPSEPRRMPMLDQTPEQLAAKARWRWLWVIAVIGALVFAFPLFRH